MYSNMTDITRCDKCKCEIPKKVNKQRFLGLLRQSYKETYYSFWFEDSYTKEYTRDFHLCKNCREKLLMWLDEQ